MNAENGQGYEPGVGALLRASRLRCGEDLRDVAALLRIRYPFLEAIEEGRYQDLPGSAYAIGFVRTYAEHLGLDAGEVVRRFKAEAENLERRSDLVFPSPIAERSTPGGAIIFVGILMAAVAYGAWYLGTAKQSFLGDLVSPLPERMTAMLRGDDEVPPVAAPEPLSAVPASPAEPFAAPEAAPPPAGGPGEGPAVVAEPEPPAAPEPAPAPETAVVPAEPTPPTAERPEPAAEAALPAPAATPAPEPSPRPAEAAPAASAPTTPAPPAATAPAPAPTAPPVETDAIPAAETATATPPPLAPTEAPSATAEAATPTASTQPPAPPEAETETAAAVDTPADTPAAAPAAVATGGGSRIVVRARLDSWIQIRDGAARRLLVTRLLRAGDTYEVPDQPSLTLLTGNAGALDILVDGEPVPAIGDIGAVRRDVALDAERLKAGTAVLD